MCRAFIALREPCVAANRSGGPFSEILAHPRKIQSRTWNGRRDAGFLARPNLVRRTRDHTFNSMKSTCPTCSMAQSWRRKTPMRSYSNKANLLTRRNELPRARRPDRLPRWDVFNGRILARTRRHGLRRNSLSDPAAHFSMRRAGSEPRGQKVQPDDHTCNCNEGKNVLESSEGRSCKRTDRREGDRKQSDSEIQL